MADIIHNFVTCEQLAKELGCETITIKRMIGRGELPPFTVGNNDGKIKAWHISVLKKHSLDKLAYDVRDSI